MNARQIQFEFPRGTRLAFSRAAGALLLLVALLVACCAKADAPVSKEYQIKAAFLYNFAKFVEWPARRFTNAESPLIIGVLGKNPFGDELERTVHGRKINNREIMIISLATVEDGRKAHIVFIPPPQNGKVAEVLARLRGAGVVTVGEGSDFTEQGGMIGFRLDGDKVRFEINTEAAEEEGLTISAQLLKLAASVHKKT